MRELREGTFSRNKNDDAHEHVERVLDIVILYNIPGVTHDVVMLCVFPITLTGVARRWSKRTSSRSSDGIVAITSKLDSLGRDMQKLKENVHAIHVGCRICEGTHLDKDYRLNKEVKRIKEVKYGALEGIFQIMVEIKQGFNGGETQPIRSLAMLTTPKRIDSSYLKETNLLAEMANMSKKTSMGTVENILVKIDIFMFPSDFVVINMLGDPNETIILGRPFLATIHARINVFRKEISKRKGKTNIVEPGTTV
uniref:Reverse transcriptase domain-containing protein n=1 Tax=Tanacetum cinerariifolium TaxID=118510 RepID=A0A6L2LBA3_TANCI|nr:hypothetical protein [Tanacetum cinerariifolium]